MIHVALPLGAAHGWGIVGKFLTKELAALTEVRLITDPFDANAVGDVLEYALFAGLVPPGSTPMGGFSGALRTAGPTLQCAVGPEHGAYRPGLRGTFNVGYSVFEENLLVAKHIDAAKRNFDALVTGTTWCREALEQAGCTNVRTVLQGVDPRLFNPHLNEKEFYRDQFVVFSGGKMELRKGQDIVIRAVAVLQQRHKDVMLINQWYNGYPASLQTMAASPLIRWQLNTSDYFQFLNQLLADNGVDLSRVISLGPQLNTTVSRVYKNTDVGVFPNRCEGATNLVMNEYMACGKPVVASFNSGHKDVLSEHNSVRVMSNTPFTYQRDGVPVGTWEEPSLEETIERLEWAYQNRDALKQIGRRGAEDQQKLSWRKAAEGFLEILQKGA
jgi:glycosyltransferase involved in cell wall biosynthesis